MGDGRNTPGMDRPLELTDAELDFVVGGTITQTNGGGNTPNGNANGVPYTNPGDKEPPGWNK
jgi:hypothetical protein